ncbi:MAG: hypothetical protein H7177_18190 [Rhizobacter sp.]|nr:hypothetical protein [Bacteriovorax sp.]
MSIALNKVIFAFILVLTVSCGKHINKISTALSSSALLEQKCASNSVPAEEVTIELETLYNNFLKKNSLTYFYIPPKNYDYQTPMVVNLTEMKSSLDRIKTEMSDDTYLQANYTTIALEVYYLFQGAMRYESSKCSLIQLSAKKINDITPYMNMKALCIDKENADICSVETLLNLNEDETNIITKNSAQMCGVLADCKINFSAEAEVAVQKRFQAENFNKLFQLRDSHLKFNCQKEDDIVTMNIKVLKADWDAEKLKALTSFVSETWSRSNFKLSIEIVTENTGDVIQIIPTTRTVSYVPDNNNRQIYLGQLLDNFTMKSVLAHEFGHVLGFPDCYTEFYDSEKKSLIYYEISRENTNLMCSLKSGVSVPGDYLDQLTQKSCLFN